MVRRPNRSASEGITNAPVTAPIPWAVTNSAVATGMSTPWRGTTPAMAGTRAMNGDANRATTAISSMAARQPGSAMATRAPATMRATMAGPSAALRDGGNRTISQRHHHRAE